MKIIVTSCWHVDLRMGGYDPHDDIVRAARQVIDATDGADLLVHMGDLFDVPKPSPRAYACVIKLLNQSQCPVVILEGNHDQGALEPLKEAEFPQEVHIADEIEVLGVGAKKLLFVPHVTDKRARETAEVSAQEAVDAAFDAARCAYEDDVRGEWRVDAVFAHLSVEGAETSTGYVMRGSELQMPLDVAKGLPVPVFNGHIHKKQTIGRNIHLSGSLVPANFGERHDTKGYLIVEV